MDMEKTIEVLQNDLMIHKKMFTSELKRMNDVVSKFGEMMDLLYLQIICTIELLDKKGIINEKEFTEQLDKIAVQLEEKAKTAVKEANEKYLKERKESGSLIDTLDDEVKSPGTGGAETKI